MRTVHVVVPDGVDDPTTPSGGNVYDRRVCQELARCGWVVPEHVDTLATVPDGAPTLVDGLVAVAAPGEVLREADRLRIVVLLHMPFGERDPALRAAEEQVLAAAAAVVTTSTWSRRWLLEHYRLQRQVHVAEPGVDPADLAPERSTGEGLLCVAAVTRDKGQHTLLAALAEVADLPWTLTCAGSLSRDPAFADRVQGRAADLGIGDRVTWAGALTHEELDKAYGAADALVLASRAESWGMVVTEALARGLPVLATDVGGVREALGSSRDGRLPGLLVPAGDPAAFAHAIRQWLHDGALRRELRTSARSRRTTLAGWSLTAEKIAHALVEVDR